MEQVATPVDCDGAVRPVMVRAVGCPSQRTYPPHKHRRAEFVYVGAGALNVMADGGIFTVPARNAILIPAGTTHEMRMLSDAQVLAAYIAVPAGLAAGAGCRLIQASNLLRELLEAAARLPTAYDPNGRDGRIMALIAEEVAWSVAQAPAEPLHTPVPKDPRLLRVCRQLLRQLDRPWSIDDAALSAGMGRRTFTRAFRQETGISFTGWCARARLNAAVGRLNAGASITEVAFESGYNSPSAFATMFKRSLGVAPSTYLETARQM